MELSLLKLIGREEELFIHDLKNFSFSLNQKIETGNFLIIGGAGSIGQSVSKEIIKRNPKKIHIVDLNENNLVELIRDIRSTIGYIEGEIKTYCIDCGSNDFERFLMTEGPYDYIFNLSALKHVRSENDPYTLTRLIEVNILNSIRISKLAKEQGIKNYFCVSTDKATNPVNLMGASKRIMEKFLFRESGNLNISLARFANVAFSDGSLLYGFNRRFEKKQPLSAPEDVLRYFLTPKESGELCLIAGLLAENREIFFPKLNQNLNLIRFSDIAKSFLKQKGFLPVLCKTEEEARESCKDLISQKKWPCYFFKSDTTGEKDFEEFYTDQEDLDMDRFNGIGIIKNKLPSDKKKIDTFYSKILDLKRDSNIDKKEVLKLFKLILPNFEHIEKGKNLNSRM